MVFFRKKKAQVVIESYPDPVVGIVKNALYEVNRLKRDDIFLSSNF